MVSHPLLSIPRESEIVDSSSHPLALWLREVLSGSQKARLPRLIVVDDEENIVQALRAGLKVGRVFYTSDRQISDRLRRALPPEAAIHGIAKRTSKKLFETSKLSRTFAVAQVPKAPELADLGSFEKDLVVLETPGISGNVGAIIRTAAAFRVGGVVLLDAEVDVYDRRLIRASRGHLFSLPVVQATTRDFLTFCGRHGWLLLVTNPRASRPVDDLAGLQGRLAIVFGNEKEGCSEALLEAAEFQIRIPTSPLVESLNVSAAAAITLFQRMRSNL